MEVFTRENNDENADIIYVDSDDGGGDDGGDDIKSVERSRQAGRGNGSYLNAATDDSEALRLARENLKIISKLLEPFASV